MCPGSYKKYKLEEGEERREQVEGRNKIGRRGEGERGREKE